MRKHQVWRWFNWVIHHGSSMRHRLYVHLELQSVHEIENREPGSTTLWGKRTLERPCSTPPPSPDV